MTNIKLTKEDYEKIKKSVEKAELKSSGEIATAFIKQSDTYALNELLFSVILTFVIFSISLFYFESVNDVLKNFFWEYSEYNAVMVYGFVTFLLIFIFYFVCNIPVIDRLIVPKKVMNEKVKNRALRYFVESGVINTKDRTGILIFISLLEKRVELIADIGIAEKIKQEEWDNVVNLIVEGIKQGNWVDNLTKGIEICGNMLEKHFERAENDENELNDNIVFLKR